MSFARFNPEEHRTRRAAEREASMQALCRTASKPIVRGVYAPVNEAVRAEPKTTPKRCPALLEMARGRQCLLCPPGNCQCRPGSVVACHSNLGIHGKAKGRKADDCYSVWGGDFAHRWLDQGGASRERKEAVFMAAHLHQVQEWRRIAGDAGEPARFRRAAQWALDALGAIPPGATQ